MANPLQIAQAIVKRLEEKADLRRRVRLGFWEIPEVNQPAQVAVTIGKDSGEWDDHDSTTRKVEIGVLVYVRVAAGGEATAFEQVHRAYGKVHAQMESLSMDAAGSSAGSFKEIGEVTPEDLADNIAAISSRWLASYTRQLGEES